MLSLSDLLLLQWHGNLILYLILTELYIMSRDDPTSTRDHKRTQVDTLWVDVFTSQNPVNYWRSFLLLSFIGSLNVYRNLYIWNETKQSVTRRGSISLSVFLSSLSLCLFMSKHQTLPATRHKINSSLKMGARHHSQNRTAQPAPRCRRNNKANKQSSLFQGYTWTEEFLGH